MANLKELSLIFVEGCFRAALSTLPVGSACYSKQLKNGTQIAYDLRLWSVVIASARIFMLLLEKSHLAWEMWRTIAITMAMPLSHRTLRIMRTLCRPLFQRFNLHSFPINHKNWNNKISCHTVVNSPPWQTSMPGWAPLIHLTVAVAAACSEWMPAVSGTTTAAS